MDAHRRDWALGRTVVAPGALASDGQQMRSRFVVVLRDAVDLAWFAPGQMRVFLSGTARSDAGIADL